MGWRTGLKYDDDFRTAWIIVALLALVLVVVFGFVVWATGSWLAALVISVLCVLGLLVLT
ncbi:hypothetical protein [Marmoricola sp. OAE513]|uniref:hypothetical protein n=1 Tax=Marmoricola sp. OAE513 TaxID=2817894 RepID=UPI001AE44B9C